MDFSHVDWQKLLGTVVAVASVLANVIPAHTVVGKIVHFVAANWNSKAMPQAPSAGDAP